MKHVKLHRSHTQEQLQFWFMYQQIYHCRPFRLCLNVIDCFKQYDTSENRVGKGCPHSCDSAAGNQVPRTRMTSCFNTVPLPVNSAWSHQIVLSFKFVYSFSVPKNSSRQSFLRQVLPSNTVTLPPSLRPNTAMGISCTNTTNTRVILLSYSSSTTN